jgi:hypothetical protein
LDLPVLPAVLEWEDDGVGNGLGVRVEEVVADDDDDAIGNDESTVNLL